ncbi:MAG TPA: hypothetical protein DEA43_00405 [Candidatus Moranbacteria bacterium]|nr:hypothetical protein [Candidatus Moranbacteria bacterium]HBT45333.1 hypothetical protein [Candidatus Moranbacteria bacterium]
MYKKIFVPAIILLVLGTNLFLGLTRLENYSAVDEPYWTYGRTSKFWESVKDANWSKTDVNDKPGITVAILSGFGLLKYDPILYKNLREKPKTDEQLMIINDINFYFRLPIFLFTLAMLPLFYFFLKKLFGKTIALISFVLIGFSPVLLGVSLIINPDSLLWIFMPLSLLAYFIFLKEKNLNYLLVSGVFLGFSLLTKYVSNLLIIFYLLLPFSEYIFSNENKEPLRAYFKRAIIDYLTLIFFATFIYFIFFPATWINLEKLLEGTFLSKAFESTWPIFAAFFIFLGLDWLVLKSKVTGWILEKISRFKNILFIGLSVFFVLIIIFTLFDTYLGMRPFDFPTIAASPKNSQSNPLLAMKSVGNIVTDFYGLIFSISPLALFGLLFGVASIVIKKKFSYSRINLTVFYLASLIVFYYLASTVNHVVATVRYQIALYPLAFIIAAIGIYKFLEFLKLTEPKHKAIAIGATAVFSLIGIFASNPHFLTYSSSLLPDAYIANYKGMGDGSYEAGQYLNTLPNAREINVWSDKGAVCAVFVGKCYTGYNAKELKTVDFKYYVVSTDRESKFSARLDFRKAYDSESFEHITILDNRPNNFVKVVAADKL